VFQLKRENNDKITPVFKIVSPGGQEIVVSGTQKSKEPAIKDCPSF
jgi:hypothetical protein